MSVVEGQHHDWLSLRRTHTARFADVVESGDPDTIDPRARVLVSTALTP